MNIRLFLTAALTIALGAAVTGSALGAGSHRHGAAYQFNGTIAAAGPSSVTLQVEGGSHNALKALIGQSQQQTFAFGSSTEILVYSGGTPHVGSPAELKPGDLAAVRIRAAAGATLAQLEATSAATITDRAAHGAVTGLLYLYQGTVAGPQSGGHVALHVTSGNWRGLRSMLGQSLDQSFTYSDGTIFLLWQARVPTVIDPSQLKAGDRITIRVRAGAAATLAQVEATPAVHVGDHEPGNPETEQ